MYKNIKKNRKITIFKIYFCIVFFVAILGVFFG